MRIEAPIPKDNPISRCLKKNHIEMESFPQICQYWLNREIGLLTRTFFDLWKRVFRDGTHRQTLRIVDQIGHEGQFTENIVALTSSLAVSINLC